MIERRTPAGTSGAEAALAVLAGYPHVAACPHCRHYAGDRLGRLAGTAVIVATLGHHDSAHTRDRLTLASQHFA